MKILVVGDLHGKIAKFKKKILKQDFDFIIGIGDYSGIDDWKYYWRYAFKLKKGDYIPFIKTEVIVRYNPEKSKIIEVISEKNSRVLYPIKRS